MKYLFDEWIYWKRRIERFYILLCLDYDGTLTPIIDHPDQAYLPKENRHLLEELAKLTDCQVAIVSGRALSDVKKLVATKNVIYVGNHGFEILSPYLAFESLIPPQFSKTLDELQEKIMSEFANMEGLILENKGITLSVHYRMVKEDQIPRVLKILNRICQAYEKDKLIKVRFGKMVCEIRPNLEWDKGKAVLWVLKTYQMHLNRENILPIYIGDDQTDEDALSAFYDKGLTAWIGTPANSSMAKYYLKDTADVTEFLNKLLQVKKKNYANSH